MFVRSLITLAVLEVGSGGALNLFSLVNVVDRSQLNSDNRRPSTSTNKHNLVFDVDDWCNNKGLNLNQCTYVFTQEYCDLAHYKGRLDVAVTGLPIPFASPTIVTLRRSEDHHSRVRNRQTKDPKLTPHMEVDISGGSISKTVVRNAEGIWQLKKSTPKVDPVSSRMFYNLLNDLATLAGK